MAHTIGKRKCRNCLKLFLPDSRNQTKQKFCSEEEWRKENPGYVKSPNSSAGLMVALCAMGIWINANIPMHVSICF